MNAEQFKVLFPLEGQVTQDILSNARLLNPWECIGALTLKAALGEEVVSKIQDISWRNWDGCVRLGNDYINIGTQENIPVIDIKQPQELTFIISPQNNLP